MTRDELITLVAEKMCIKVRGNAAWRLLVPAERRMFLQMADEAVMVIDENQPIKKAVSEETASS